jgi:hypothetical protein
VPPPPDHADFEIELRSTQRGFEARVLTSPLGRVAAPFLPPFSTDEVEDILTALEQRVGASARRDLSPEASGAEPAPARPPGADASAIGRSLFAALFSGPIETRFRESLASLRTGPGTSARAGLRVRLTFDRQEDFARLATLPWELLLDDRQFLALHRRTPIVRSHNGRSVPQPVAALPLRVLLVDSRPTDLRPLDTGRETQLIEAALARNPLIEPIHLPHPNVRHLREQLIDTPCQVLHFMGHGDPGEHRDDEFVLWFENDRGKAEAVTGELLAEYVKDAPELRLVVLSSCWGGALPRRQGQDPYTGVAAALMVRDIPAVVAMQFPITDEAAIAFGEVFYGRLVAGDSVCEAVTEGRLEILRRNERSLEWATPTLFLAGGDRLFDVSSGKKRPASSAGARSTRARRDRRRPAPVRPLLLAIRSFQGFVGTPEKPDDVLKLTDLFSERHIRRVAAWHEEVFPRLRDFLLRHAAARRPIVLDMAAHASIAFAAGYCLEAKSGLDITLLQKGQRTTVAWRAEAGPARPGPLWLAEADRPRLPGATDVAIAVSVTWPILDDVEHYLDTSKTAIKRLIPMTLHPQPGPRAVEGGLHALELAQGLAWKARGRSVAERGGVLHLFSAAPNALLFYLGQLGKSLGAVQLYEHDFESGQPGAYQPSLRLPIPRTPGAANGAVGAP